MPKEEGMKAKYFKLYWRGDSKPEIVCGSDIADAVKECGMGVGEFFRAAALTYAEANRRK